MDIYLQNRLGFDVYVTAEADENILTVRLYPIRQRVKRGHLVQRMLKDGEGVIIREQPEDADVRFDLTALSFRVRIMDRTASDGDRLYEFKLQNGHGHAP